MLQNNMRMIFIVLSSLAKPFVRACDCVCIWLQYTIIIGVIFLLLIATAVVLFVFKDWVRLSIVLWLYLYVKIVVWHVTLISGLTGLNSQFEFKSGLETASNFKTLKKSFELFIGKGEKAFGKISLESQSNVQQKWIKSWRQPPEMFTVGKEVTTSIVQYVDLL